MPTGHAAEFLIALVVAWIYLTLVRFVDLNEREPVWSLALVFLLGAAAAGGTHLLVSPVTLRLTLLPGALVEETAKALSLAAGVAIFAAVERMRGWSELSDIVDGLVYGITVGLGYSVGEVFLNQLRLSGQFLPQALSSPWQAVAHAAAFGLAHGVFAGVTGLGFGLALSARGRPGRIAYPLLGLVGATLLNSLFRVLAHGNALAGQSALVRAWLAVLLPLAMLAAIAGYGLTAERQAICRQLTPELENGTLTSAELALLDSFWKRQGRYLALLLRGRVNACLHLAALHNRQVQLALAKRQAEGEPSPHRQERLARRIGRLRQAVLEARAAATLVALALAVGAVTSPGSLAAQGADWSSLDALVGAAHRDLDGYWGRTLGQTYVPPLEVIPYSPSTACPFRAGNAEYCQRVRSIYYDPGLLEHLWHDTGDFAAVFVVAHEWGHLVQDLRGVLQPEAGMWSVQRELQADCLAGQFARSADQERRLDPGDDREALGALREAGDTTDNPWFDTRAHGSSGQRVDGFLQGLDGRECDGERFWARVHLPPDVLSTKATPKAGSLLESRARQKGRFGLVEIHPYPDVITGDVTDAVTATYRAPDGAEVTYYAMAYATEAAAEQALGTVSTSLMKKKNYTVTKEGPVEDGGRHIGAWKLLTGATEIVLFTNSQTLEAAEGPHGLAWEFMTSANTSFASR